MLNKNDAVRRTKEFFANKRFLANEDYERRKRIAESKIPELKDIDEELALLGSKVFLAGIQGGNVEERISELKRENRYLLSKRAELLLSAGLPEDYTDIKYECQICNDTGFVGTKMCDCMRKAIMVAGFEDAGISKIIEKQTFDTFSLDYYAGVERDAIGKNVQILRNYAENFGPQTTQNWLFLGGTGLGKTHLSTAVAKTVIERGYSVVYNTAQSIIGEFEKQRFSRDSADDSSTDEVFTCDLLILDDLGTEMSNQFTISCLYNIINTRINTGKPIIANTNLSQQELREKYADRITSRLFGEFRPLVFVGKDIRAQKLLNR